MTNNLLNIKLKQLESLDAELSILYKAYKKTENRWLWFHLFVWFPILQLTMIVLHRFVKDTEKWKGKNDKFPFLQLVLIVFEGSVFWTFFKDTQKGSMMAGWIEYFHHLPTPVLLIGCFVVWYALTIASLRIKMTDPHSAFFLWRAYRKWDVNYNWCGSFIESGNYMDVIKEVASAVEKEATQVVEAEEIKEIFEEFEALKKALDEKNFIIERHIKMKIQLCDAIIKQGRLSYKHLDILDMPFIVYKEENDKLVYKDDNDYLIPYQKEISLENKKNFFVRVYRRRKTPLEDKGRIGFRITAQDDSVWIIVLKSTNGEEYQILEKYGIIKSDEIKMIFEAIVSNVKG